MRLATMYICKVYPVRWHMAARSLLKSAMSAQDCPRRRNCIGSHTSKPRAHAASPSTSHSSGTRYCERHWVQRRLNGVSLSRGALIHLQDFVLLHMARWPARARTPA